MCVCLYEHAGIRQAITVVFWVVENELALNYFIFANEIFYDFCK